MPETKESNPKDAVGVRKWRQFAAVPLTVLSEVGVALLEGARKYGRHNYRVAGVRASVYVDAAFGHLVQWWEGEDIDSVSKLSHITKAIASLVVLRDAMIQDKLTDDRPPKANLDRVREDLQRAVDHIFENWPESVPPYLQTDAASKPLFSMENVASPEDIANRLAWLESVKGWKPATKDPESPLIFTDYADLEQKIMAQISKETGLANFSPDVTSRSVQPLLEEMANEGWTFYLEPVSGAIQATRPAAEDRPAQALSLKATPGSAAGLSALDRAEASLDHAIGLVDELMNMVCPPQSFPTDGHDSTPVTFATCRKVKMPPEHVADYKGVTSAEQVERVVARDLTRAVLPENFKGLPETPPQDWLASYPAPSPAARQISAGDLAFVNDDPAPPAPPAFGDVRDAYVDFLKLVLSGDTQHPEYLTSRAQLATFTKALGSSNQVHGQPQTHSTRDQQKYHWQFLLGTLARLPGFSEKSASAIGELWPRHLQDCLAHKADML